MSTTTRYSYYQFHFNNWQQIHCLTLGKHWFCILMHLVIYLFRELCVMFLYWWAFRNGGNRYIFFCFSVSSFLKGKMWCLKCESSIKIIQAWQKFILVVQYAYLPIPAWSQNTGSSKQLISNYFISDIEWIIMKIPTLEQKCF